MRFYTPRILRAPLAALAAAVFFSVFIPRSVAADGFDAEQSFRSAMTAFKEKSFYSARLLLQEIVLKDARGEYGDDAQYYLAMTYFYDGDYKSAQFEHRVLQRDYPESPYIARSVFWSAESWFYRKQYREALEAHAAFIRKYRENILCASSLYTMGYIYNEQKRYDEAIAEFKRALKDYPETSAAAALTLQLGIAYFNAAEYAPARRQFETLLNKYATADNLDQARFWLGKSYYAENNFPDALREFAAVVKDYSTSPQASEAMYLSALCHYKAGAISKALQALAKTAADYPKSSIYPFVRLRQAQLMKEQDNLADALSPLLDIINNFREHETFAPALALLAEIRQKQGKSDEAAQTFEALRNETNLTPKSKRELLRQYADLLYQEKHYNRSTEIYTELAKESTTADETSENYLLLARAEYKDGKYDAALASIEKMGTLGDDRTHAAEALFLKAEISYALSKFTPALQLYARVVRKFPKHAKAFDAQMGIGWTYFELRQYARAADQFRKILKAYKAPREQARALIALGACRYNLRDLEGALKSYQTVTKQFAGEKEEAAEAQYQIAWLEFRRNRFTAAATEFQGYLKYGDGTPHFLDAQYFLALCHFQLGDYAHAEERLQALAANIKITPWLKEKVFGDWGKTQLALKNYTGARETFRRLVTEFPDSQGRDEALFQLVVLSFKLGDEKTATSDLAELQKHPNSPWYTEALRERADYERRTKQFSAADATLTELEKLQRKPAEKIDTLVARAEIAAEQGKSEQAIRYLDDALAKEDINDTTAIKASTVLFRELEKLNKNDEAIRRAEQFAIRFIGNKSVSDEMRIQQAKFLLRASQSDEARERLAELTKSRSVADRARFMLAETYFNDGDETRALDYFRQISQKHDSATWLKARFFIGEILFKRGEYEDAAREFSRIAFADTRDDSVYEKALYRAALCFIKTKKQREAETFRAKLKEAFPHSKYLPELQ